MDEKEKDNWTFDKSFEDYWSGGDSYVRGSYSASQSVKDAQDALNALLAQKPNAYQSAWQDQISDTISKITNRDKFSYDVNGDALYQQYKDKYIQQGKLAMADTMGQAAALTGGYGNSYAAAVGNQAYQAQLNNLNDIVPELYQMAYDRYNQETQDLYNQYSLYADRDNADYGKYRDTVNDWQSDRNYLSNRYDSERNFDYGVYSDQESAAQAQWNSDRAAAYDQYINDYNNAYDAYRDSVADSQWDKQYGLVESEHNATMTEKGYVKDNDGSYVPAPVVVDEGGVGGVSDAIKNKVANYTTKDGQANYVAGLVNSGKITEDQAMALLDEYGVTELTDRSWEMVDDGGVNWLWGVDNDAVVRDENGKEYSLKELEKELKKTMTNKEAKNYIKELQDQLGI